MRQCVYKHLLDKRRLSYKHLLDGLFEDIWWMVSPQSYLALNKLSNQMM